MISICSSSLYNFKSKAKLCSSLVKTLNDSGIPGFGILSPLTIASYVFKRPTISSDLTVNISCSMYDAP